MKAIVVFYSLSNHTGQVARLIAEATSSPIEELHTAEPYGEERLMDLSKIEIENGSYRSLRPLSHRIEDYDVVFLGTPTWWVSAASPVLAFIRDNELRGKHVYPFITTGFDVHGVEEKLDAALLKKGAIAEKALIVPFNNAFMDKDEEEIKSFGKNAK